MVAQNAPLRSCLRRFHINPYGTLRLSTQMQEATANTDVSVYPAGAPEEGKTEEEEEEEEEDEETRHVW